MIESEKVYKGNCFKGLINNHIFQIISMGREEQKWSNCFVDNTIYINIKDITTGRKSQTNYDTFIRLQLEECEYPI